MAAAAAASSATSIIASGAPPSPPSQLARAASARLAPPSSALASTALRLSAWSLVGSFTTARALARVDDDVRGVRDDVRAGYAILEALRASLGDALASARAVTQRLDAVEGGQAEMQATLAECTAQLRRSRASLSQLDARLQALLSARVRADALVDGAAVYVALGLLRGAALPLDAVAWAVSRASAGGGAVARGGARLLALVLRGALLLLVLRALRGAARRAGLHSGVGTAAAYASELARWQPARRLLDAGAALVARVAEAAGAGSPVRHTAAGGGGPDDQPHCPASPPTPATAAPADARRDGPGSPAIPSELAAAAGGGGPPASPATPGWRHRDADADAVDDASPTRRARAASTEL